MNLDYEINKGTLAIIPLNDGQSVVYEDDERYIINSSPYKIMEHSCLYHGSSYDGRKESAKAMLGAEYKVPIMVDELNTLVFFPTESPKSKECCFISSNRFKTKEKIDGITTKIKFDNNQEIIVPCSLRSVENQVYRSNSLESNYRKIKNI